MLPLRAAFKSALGTSFDAPHVGPAGSILVPVAVADAGKGDETPLPAVFLHSEFGTGSPANIGGRASDNVAALDLHIQTVDDPAQWDGAQLLADIQAAIEALLRAHEKTLGAAHFAWSASYRDLGPKAEQGGFTSYTRIVTVRAINLETY